MNKRRFLLLKATVEKEIKNIESIEERIQKYAKILAAAISEKKQFETLNADDLCILVGATLDDFYLAAENIFKSIAVELDGGLPAGDQWHKQLLESMALEISGIRPPVLMGDTVAQLDELRRFRHLFRNIYGFALNAGRVAELAQKVPNISRLLKNDIEKFFARMQDLYFVPRNSRN